MDSRVADLPQPGPAASDGDAYRRLTAAYQQSLRYAEDVRRLYGQLQRSIYQSLLGLANAVEAKDPYTHGHSERVSRWSRLLAVARALDAGAADVIAQAGLLHDIGKIGVPESVLRKTGPLDAGEWAQMRRHPLIGANIVAPLEFFGAGALVIRHHHERLDGSGYPDGLTGDQIPLGARIVAVADVYDALTSARPYRTALPADVARARLVAEAGRTLDADLVAAFLDLMGGLEGPSKPPSARHAPAEPWRASTARPDSLPESSALPAPSGARPPHGDSLTG